MANKLTKKDMFMALSQVINGQAPEIMVGDQVTPITVPELQAFIDRELELLAKKANAKKSQPTLKQQQNAEYKAIILKIMSDTDKPLTISDLIKLDDSFADFSNQKMASLIKLLREENKVERFYQKGKAYFQLIPNDSEKSEG